MERTTLVGEFIPFAGENRRIVAVKATVSDTSGLLQRRQVMHHRNAGHNEISEEVGRGQQHPRNYVDCPKNVTS
jgi:hypothetical protein